MYYKVIIRDKEWNLLEKVRDFWVWEYWLLLFGNFNCYYIVILVDMVRLGLVVGVLR